jgi:hypothetical protein
MVSTVRGWMQDLFAACGFANVLPEVFQRFLKLNILEDGSNRRHVLTESHMLGQILAFLA